MFELKVDPTNAFGDMTTIDFAKRCGGILHRVKEASEVGMDLQTALKPLFGENPKEVKGAINNVDAFHTEVETRVGTGRILKEYENEAHPPLATIYVNTETCHIYESMVAVVTPGANHYVVVA